METIIYLRTSTKEQNPELQRKQCIDFCQRMGLDVVEVVSEQGSAYKLEKIRPKWESVVERAKKEKLNVVIWRYDRSFRNRKEFFIFMKVMFEVYNKKVYSVTEPSILNFWEMMDKFKSESPIVNELLKNILKAIWDFLIQMAGEEAEGESRKKSERVKLAIVKEEGKETKSYKGNKWGRKALKIDEQIIILQEKGKTMRDICKEVFYWDKNNHKKFVSIGYVQKVVHKYNIENSKDKNLAEVKEIN